MYVAILIGILISFNAHSEMELSYGYGFRQYSANSIHPEWKVKDNEAQSITSFLYLKNDLFVPMELHFESQDSFIPYPESLFSHDLNPENRLTDTILLSLHFVQNFKYSYEKQKIFASGVVLDNCSDFCDSSGYNNTLFRLNGHKLNVNDSFPLDIETEKHIIY